MYLRPARPEDAGALHELFCVPEVYRFLADGAPPPPAVADAWTTPLAPGTPHGLGTWLLIEDRGIVGCVTLAAQQVDPANAELTYLLHPRMWGRGLATRMAWTVMEAAFEGGGIRQVTAGTDLPNIRSRRVMERLGMAFARDVDYPAGAGVEFERVVGMSLPSPVPEPIEVRER